MKRVGTMPTTSIFMRTHKGSAMLLAVVAVGAAFVIGLTFLSSSATTTGVAQNMSDHAQARQVAETTLGMVVRYIEQAPDWRNQRTSGAWITDMSLLGGLATVTGTFDPVPTLDPLAVDDASFEQEIASLPNPLLNPPMSGAIGGWAVQRTAALVTGPTVPLIAVETSADATDGSQLASINFLSSVQSTGLFRQTLAHALEPNTTYALTVDVAKTILAPQLADVEIRVYAGATLIAVSVDPSVFTAMNESADPSMVDTENIGGGVSPNIPCGFRRMTTPRPGC